MDIQQKKDHTRLKNLLTNYRNEMIYNIIPKHTWKNLPQIINQVDEAIYIINEGL